jgi:hypothetical protein
MWSNLWNWQARSSEKNDVKSASKAEQNWEDSYPSWQDAYWRAIADPTKSQTEHYFEMLDEKKMENNEPSFIFKVKDYANGKSSIQLIAHKYLPYSNHVGRYLDYNNGNGFFHRSDDEDKYRIPTILVSDVIEQYKQQELNTFNSTKVINERELT